MGPYISLLGMATLMALGVALSKDRRAINPRTVASAFLLLVAVAATMIIAELAGIEVIATGGIRGVRRGAQQSVDVSADLEELANTRLGARIAVALQRHRANLARADDSSRNSSV
jgi:pseudouridine-5'-phosphate glycosidase